MGAALDDLQRAVPDPVDQAVCLIDPAGPPALEVLFQGLRLPKAAEGIALRVPDELVDPPQGFLVLGLPVQVILPGLIIPYLFHASSSSWAVPRPSSMRRAAASRRDWFSVEKKGSALISKGIPLCRTSCLRKTVVAVVMFMPSSASTASACCLRASSMRMLMFAMIIASLCDKLYHNVRTMSI
nr:MAG TPA_asm: hypothetical protein [Caudoviricetes sp.]